MHGSNPRNFGGLPHALFDDKMSVNGDDNREGSTETDNQNNTEGMANKEGGTK